MGGKFRELNPRAAAAKFRRVGKDERLERAGLAPEAKAQADREMNRLASIPTASPEHSMVRTYLEWLADLPWSTATSAFTRARSISCVARRA